MLTFLKTKIMSLAMFLTGTTTEGTGEVVEKLEGWDKLVDWAGGNFNALLIVVVGPLLALGIIYFIYKKVKKAHNKNYVKRDRVAWYKKRRY